MTTIATDGKVMVADSRACAAYAHSVVKMRRLADGRVMGLAGDFQWFEPVAKYFETGKDKPACHEADFAVLLLHPSGRVDYAESNLALSKAKPPVAIGSGSGFAMAALLAGAPLRKAVEIAAKLDPQSGGPIKVIKR